ncbi:hypothetical protein EU556_16260 [Hymenobacter fodinae]|uniref:Glycosyltransferase RgtA/B/C/D-like domain-containing protein n=1 Tax=Hymenobacter fodinae TaxID=2510796 RepID=A0A4Z0P6U6_9BACT|nr:hypothetical protein EU556_16260 [Hymenobacter fodinae]
MWLLSTGGALSFPDEDRYLESIKAAHLLLTGDLELAALHLANTQGRPSDALLRLPVALAQVAWQHFGGPPPETPASLLLPQLMNYMVLLGNTLLLCKLGRSWLSSSAALLAGLVYAALGNSNIYLRHVLPYDLALLILLGTLVLLTQPYRPIGNVRRIGLLTGLLAWGVVAVYPGYYFAPLLIGSVLLMQLPRASWHRGLFWMLSGASLLILTLELITRYGHISYLRSLQTLGPSIIQGDFAEGFTFTGRYLWEIEGTLGVLLLLLALPGIAVLVRSGVQNRKLLPLALAPLGLWLLHACLVYFGHKFVFYGRILHFFIPFLVLHAVTALTALPPMLRRLGQGVLVGLALWGFVRFISQYERLAYPRDVLARLGVSAQDQLTYLNEHGLAHAWDYSAPPAGKLVNSGGRSLLLINFTYPYPLSPDRCVSVPAQAAPLLFSGPHFLTFPAYGFEGFTPPERHFLRSCPFQCRVYQK